MRLEDLKKIFSDLKPPKILIELLGFVNVHSKNDWFSDGFEFYFDEKKQMLKTYSEENDFLNSLIEFAQADGTGSTYAF
ncbi:hypothetical protein [Tenacibaculum sp. M341]|uniref:hypothetical protein n=1 Tax=Tenacibaculum sp. M341 TaxID=2530339 RepID=UPI00104E0F9B|nr:hypothetical protein [Tenacibaculum sp. M341]TCI89984.1 hypothetical protein EYW44_15065 [Tenacibaculum sp. M341]